MTEEQAFKFGFLQTCLEAGMDEAAIREKIAEAKELVSDPERFKQRVKMAGLEAGAAPVAAGGGGMLGSSFLGGLLGKAITGTPAALWDTTKVIGAGIGGAGLMGLGLGYTGGQAENAFEIPEPKETQDLELLAEYKRLTDQVRRNRAMKEFAQRLERTGQVFV